MGTNAITRPDYVGIFLGILLGAGFVIFSIYALLVICPTILAPGRDPISGMFVVILGLGVVCLIYMIRMGLGSEKRGVKKRSPSVALPQSSPREVPQEQSG